MIVVRIESTRDSYSIVKANNLKRLLDYIGKAYDEDYLKNVKVLKSNEYNLNRATDVDRL